MKGCLCLPFRKHANVFLFVYSKFIAICFMVASHPLYFLYVINDLSFFLFFLKELHRYKKIIATVFMVLDPILHQK